MMNGTAIRDSVCALLVLAAFAVGVAMCMHSAACTPTQRAAIKEAGDFARDVHQCRVLNPDRTAMSLCMAGVAMRYAGENLDEPIDGGAD